MKKILLVLAVALVFLLPIASADIGPHPPYWMTVTLNVTYNGAPVPDNANVTAFCHPSYNASSTETAEFLCAGGICHNKNVYGLTRCYNGDIFFNISHPSFPSAYATQAVRIGEAGSQPAFGIRLGPGSAINITEMQIAVGPDGNETIIPKPPKELPVCPLGLILMAFPFALLFCRR